MQRKCEKTKDKRISVRLDAEASKKLADMQAKGYTTSQYINTAIKGSTSVEIDVLRAIMIHISNLQSKFEFEEDTEVKRAMRRELNEICLVLKSSLDHT